MGNNDSAENQSKENKNLKNKGNGKENSGSKTSKNSKSGQGKKRRQQEKGNGKAEGKDEKVNESEGGKKSSSNLSKEKNPNETVDEESKEKIVKKMKKRIVKKKIANKKILKSEGKNDGKNSNDSEKKVDPTSKKGKKLEETKAELEVEEAKKNNKNEENTQKRKKSVLTKLKNRLFRNKMLESSKSSSEKEKEQELKVKSEKKPTNLKKKKSGGMWGTHVSSGSTKKKKAKKRTEEPEIQQQEEKSNAKIVVVKTKDNFGGSSLGLVLEIILLVYMPSSSLYFSLCCLSKNYFFWFRNIRSVQCTRNIPFVVRTRPKQGQVSFVRKLDLNRYRYKKSLNHRSFFVLMKCFPNTTDVIFSKISSKGINSSTIRVLIQKNKVQQIDLTDSHVGITESCFRFSSVNESLRSVKINKCNGMDFSRLMSLLNTKCRNIRKIRVSEVQNDNYVDSLPWEDVEIDEDVASHFKKKPRGVKKENIEKSEQNQNTKSKNVNKIKSSGKNETLKSTEREMSSNNKEEKVTNEGIAKKNSKKNTDTSNPDSVNLSDKEEQKQKKKEEEEECEGEGEDEEIATKNDSILMNEKEEVKNPNFLSKVRVLLLSRVVLDLSPGFFDTFQTNLEILNLEGNFYVDDRTLGQIFRRLRKLKVLVVKDCDRISRLPVFSDNVSKQKCVKSKDDDTKNKKKNVQKRQQPKGKITKRLRMRRLDFSNLSHLTKPKIIKKKKRQNRTSKKEEEDEDEKNIMKMKNEDQKQKKSKQSQQKKKNVEKKTPNDRNGKKKQVNLNTPNQKSKKEDHVKVKREEEEEEEDLNEIIQPRIFRFFRTVVDTSNLRQLDLENHYYCCQTLDEMGEGSRQKKRRGKKKKKGKIHNDDGSENSKEDEEKQTARPTGLVLPGLIATLGLPRLVRANFRNCGVGDEDLLCISKNCPFIQRLYLKRNKKLTDKGMPHLSHIRKLRELEIADCQKITDRGIGSLVQACRFLHTLDLSFLLKVTNGGMIHLAKLGGLETLVLDCVSCVTNEGLRTLSKSPCNIYMESLVVSGCHGIDDTGLMLLSKFKGLRNLEIGFNYQISNEGINAHLKHLKKLDIRNCSRLHRYGADGLEDYSEKYGVHVVYK